MGRYILALEAEQNLLLMSGVSIRKLFRILCMRITAILLIISLLPACSTNSHKKDEQQKEKYDTSYHLINVNGIVFNDTNSFRQLRCGLFINHAGDIAFRTSDNSYKMDSTINGPVDVYLTTIWNAQPYDSVTEGRDELKNVVDTVTFQQVDVEYFKDKNHVYHFSPRLDGGSLTVMDYADPETFKVLKN